MPQRPIDSLLDKYGESHQNATNKIIHWICVPSIMFSLMGLLYSIPFFGIAPSPLLNWASLLVALTFIYYLRLSIPMFIGFLPIGLGLLYGNHYLAQASTSWGIAYGWLAFSIFFIAWVGQFIGHKIEGAKPSFIEDLQFLLVGPAWLLHFIYKSFGIKY